MSLKEALKRLAGEIDPDHLVRARALQDAAWRHEEIERIPVLMLNAKPPEWPTFPYRETVDNPEKMLLNELMGVYAGALLKDDRVLAVRANFGPGVIPSLFGAEWVQIDDQTPSIKPVGGREEVRALVAGGVPSLDKGLGGGALEFQRFFLDALRSEPGLEGSVRLFLSDTQSPMSNALQLWGEDLYAAMIEEPQLVHALLDLLTRTIIAFTVAQKANTGEAVERVDHFFYSVPGGIRIVDDVSMNLSSAMYREFCKPYHERLFEEFGGGYMHYCGHKLQSQGHRLETEGLRGIEMGFDNPGRNPEYRLDKIWRQAYGAGRAVLWMYEGLPEARPSLGTGLLYGYRNTGAPWAEMKDRMKRAVEFWRN
jgi:hypothetical protein